MREASAKVAVADSHYGNTANLIALAQTKDSGHVADLRSDRAAKRGNLPGAFRLSKQSGLLQVPSRTDPPLDITLFLVAAITSSLPPAAPSPACTASAR